MLKAKATGKKQNGEKEKLLALALAFIHLFGILSPKVKISKAIGHSNIKSHSYVS
jgi:hypothetical protein